MNYLHMPRLNPWELVIAAKRSSQLLQWSSSMPLDADHPIDGAVLYFIALWITIPLLYQS
jgi:hypothetical protein